MGTNQTGERGHWAGSVWEALVEQAVIHTFQLLDPGGNPQHPEEGQIGWDSKRVVLLKYYRSDYLPRNIISISMFLEP